MVNGAGLPRPTRRLAPPPLASHLRVVVDVMFSFLHDFKIMRRLWLTLLLALSVAFGAVASASAAQNCPFKSASATTHDCCPDGATGKMSDGDHHSKKPADCQLGQACRGAVAVAPSLPLLGSAPIERAAAAPILTAVQHVPAVSLAFWRPPRIV